MRTILFALFATLSLFSVSSTIAQQPEAPSSMPVIAPTPSEEVKKEGLQVTWVDNPEFEIRLYRSVPKLFSDVVVTGAQAVGKWKTDLPPSADGIPQLSVKYGDTFYRNKRDMFGKIAPQTIKERIEKVESAKLAQVVSITLIPIYGVQSVDGFGSNMMVRAEIKTTKDVEPLIVDVMYESGIHWTGVHNNLEASPKDVMQVVDKLIKTLVSMGTT